MGEEGHAGSSCYVSRSLEEVFVDYDGRQKGILNALLHYEEDLFQQCWPDIEIPLCLYAFPDQSWKILRLEELENRNDKLPRPMIGINVPRDNVLKLDWLTLVMMNSDSWLLSVAAYFATCNGFHENETVQLDDMIKGVSSVPDAFKVANYEPKLTSAEDSHHPTTQSEFSPSVGTEIPKSKPSTPMRIEIPKPVAKQDQESGDSEVTCATCEGKRKEVELWISCDLCERWYHGDWVNIMLDLNKDLEFTCPSCGLKSGRTAYLL